MSPWGGFPIITYAILGLLTSAFLFSIFISLLSTVVALYSFLRRKNFIRSKQIAIKWLIIGLCALALNIFIYKDVFYQELIHPLVSEINKCRSDIAVEIDNKNLLIPRDSEVYKTRWTPEQKTNKTCSINNIDKVKKIYWRNLKISSAEEYYSKNQTWWDWRKYEISLGNNREIVEPYLEKIELEDQNKEFYIYEKAKEFTADKQPIIFQCMGLEKYLSLNLVSGGIKRTQDWKDKHSPEHKYCFTSYLHESGLVYSYSFLRKAHNAPYFPRDYPEIDAKMREQFSLFLRGAMEKQEKISNVVSDIKINRFAGSSDDERFKDKQSYMCSGDVTLAIGHHYIRLPRSRLGAPTSMSITFNDIGQYKGGAAQPDNDCGVEYIDNIRSISQVWGPFTFSTANNNYKNRYSLKMIEKAKQAGIEKKLENGVILLDTEREADVFVLPMDKAPTANNEAVVYECFNGCMTSYMHPSGLMVSYGEKHNKIDAVLEYDLIMRKKIQEFLDNAKLIPVSK